MMEDELGKGDAGALEASLQEREQLLSEYANRELALVDQTLSQRAEKVGWWESLITETRLGAWSQQMSSYKSLAKSMAGLLGSSVKEQAKVMIPFEIAEATKELARFLGSGDPRALASSLKHALAAKQYASSAKSAGAAPVSGGGAASARATTAAVAGEPGREERAGQTRVVVNVGRQVGVVDTYEFARNLIDAINENVGDDVVLEVSS